MNERVEASDEVLSQEERLKKTLTPPCPGLIPIGFGVFISKRLVGQIRRDIKRKEKRLRDRKI